MTCTFLSRSIIFYMLTLFLAPDASSQETKSKLNDQETRAKLQKRDELSENCARLREEGKFDDAIEVAKNMLVLELEVLGADSPDVEGSYELLAGLHEDAKRWDEAKVRRTVILERAVAMNQPNWKVIDAKLAIQNLEVLRSLSTELMSKLHKSDEIDKKSKNAFKAGNFTSALKLSMEVADSRKEILGEMHPKYSASIHDLATVNFKLGDYAQAEQLFLRSIEIDRAIFGELHPNFTESLNGLGMLYFNMGSYARAEPLYNQAIEIEKVLLGEKHTDYAMHLSNLAMLYQKMGDNNRAVPLLKQAVETCKVADDEPNAEYATCINNLGFLYSIMGDYERAEPVLQEAIEVSKEVFGPMHPNFAISLNNLALLYKNTKKYELAEALYMQSLGIKKNAFSDKHPDYATSLNNLGTLYIQKQEYARAVPFLMQSVEILKATLGEQHPIYATSLNNLGGVYERMGDYTQAERFFKQSLEIRKLALSELHPDYAQNLHNLAWVCSKLGEHTRAIPLYEQVISISRQNLDLAAYVLSERQQLAMNQSLRYQLDHYIQTCLALQSTPPNAVANVMLWKGSVLFRLRRIRIATNEPLFSDQFAELQSVSSKLSKVFQATPNPKQMMDWKSTVSKLTIEKEALETKLMQSNAAFRQSVQQVTFAEIRQSIPEDAVLIDYLEFDGKEGRSLVASIVRRVGEPVIISLGSANHASEAIELWRETFGMSPQGKSAGQQLRKQIWEPLLEHIDSAKTILVSTDGVLGRLPMGALPGKEPGSYLIEDHRIALIPVPQLLPALVNEKGSKKLKRELLLMGDVNYDADPSQDGSEVKRMTPPRKRPGERSEVPAEVRGDVRWNALSETRGEVENIAGLYKRLFQPTADAVLDLRQSAASETAFRNHAPESEFLHLATHGFFAAPEAKSALSAELIAQRGNDREAIFGKEREVLRGHNPGQLSGIVFAGANRKPSAIDPLSNEEQPDDGIMTADEIAFLRLEGVRLVVLSACETGLGEVAGGEGLLGIQRSFQIAGARSTIASLWKVNDSATRRLMQEFYTNYLDKEMSVLDALREAQLWAIKNPGEVPRGMKRNEEPEKPTQLPPQYWAPFVLSGDWR